MERFMVTTTPRHQSPSIFPLIIQQLKLKRRQQQQQKPNISPKSSLIYDNNNNNISTTQQIHGQRQQQRNPNIFPKSSLISTTQQIHSHMIVTQFDHSLQSIPQNLVRPHMSVEAQHNFLITSYNTNNSPETSLAIYAHLRRMGDQVDCFTIPSVLKACGHCSAAELGKEIHGYVFKSGLNRDAFVGNALVMMYSECGSVVFARQVFDGMADRNVISWNTMIRSCVRNGLLGEALELVKGMYSAAVRPSEMGLITMANLFAGLGDVELGKAMHGYALRNGSGGKFGVSIDTSLVDMYVKCEKLVYAKRVFDGLDEKSVVAWTVMIAGFIHYKELKEGRRYLYRMLRMGNVLNEITLLSLVAECKHVGALSLGRWLHSYILRKQVVVSLRLATAMVDMFGKCGDLGKARAVFDGRNDKDKWIWNVMISAYVRANCNDQACSLFSQMMETGARPNEAMMVSLISLCAEVGAFDMGKWLHLYINQQGLEADWMVKTALIDMYAKCGDLDGAHWLFIRTTDRDIFMWNAMMTGFAMHGCGNEAFKLFEEMERLGIEPNGTTFVSLLKACSHAGLVSEGRSVFDKMVHFYKLVPRIEHYGCVVDLLGRAGQLIEAHEFIKSMPIKPNTVVWGSLVASCKIHRNPELGEVAAKELFKLEPSNLNYNILMSNMYASASRWKDVARMRLGVKDSGIKKQRGISSIEVDGSIHDFVTGDMAHPQMVQIYEMMDDMIIKQKEDIYTPNTSVVFQNIDKEEKEKETPINYHSKNIDEEEKETTNNYHSEKFNEEEKEKETVNYHCEKIDGEGKDKETIINYHSKKPAMGSGLISKAASSAIRIVKNLRNLWKGHNC